MKLLSKTHWDLLREVQRKLEPHKDWSTRNLMGMARVELRKRFSGTSILEENIIEVMAYSLSISFSKITEEIPIPSELVNLN